MNRRTLFLTWICIGVVGGLAELATAIVMVSSLGAQVKSADAVIIAQPVRLTKLITTTDDMIYEIGEFRIKRVLVSEHVNSPSNVNPDDQTICVLRIWHEPSVDFEKFTRQEFDKDRDYVLVLNETGVDGCYRPVERFQKLIPPDGESMPKLLKAMYGDEREPLAVEPVVVENALELAKESLTSTAAGIHSIAKLDDDAYLALAFEGTDEQKRDVLQKVFGPMKENRYVVSIVAKPQKSYVSPRGSSSGYIGYHAQTYRKHAFDGKFAHDADIFGRKWKRVLEESDREAFVMPSWNYGRLLIARQSVETQRGLFTIEVAIKIGEGPAGLPRVIDYNAEARKNKAAY